MDFAHWIKNMRQAQKKTIACLSKQSGIPPTTINSYERGFHPTIERADKLLKALGISMTIGIDSKVEAIPPRLEEYPTEALWEELLRRKRNETD